MQLRVTFNHLLLVWRLTFCVCVSAQSYWTDWSEWGACSTTACDDVGIQVRHRKCVNSQPLPLLLVPACQGHHSERRECSTPPCTGENPQVYSSKDIKKKEKMLLS